MIIDCEPSPLFTLHEYVLPDFVASAIKVVRIPKTNLKRFYEIIIMFFCKK